MVGIVKQTLADDFVAAPVRSRVQVGDPVAGSAAMDSLAETRKHLLQSIVRRCPV